MKTRFLLLSALASSHAAVLLPGFCGTYSPPGGRSMARHKVGSLGPLSSVRVATKDAFLDTEYILPRVDVDGGKPPSLGGIHLTETKGLRGRVVVDEDSLGLPRSDFSSVEVGHGIKCHSLAESLHEATTPEQQALKSIVARLHDAATFVSRSPDAIYNLDFTMKELSAARAEIAQEYHAGERSMTKLAHLLANRFAGGDYECISSLRAKTETAEEFSISETLSPHDLKGGADSLALATKQLHDVLVNTKRNGEATWDKPRMIDHCIEFESLEENDWGMHRIVGRARPYKDLWKMVADTIFGIDHPDFGVREFGHSNTFHIKVLVEEPDQAESFRKQLGNLVFNDAELRDHNIPISDSTRKIELLSRTHHGLSVNWQGTKIGIEVITLDEHYEQQELSNMNRKAEKLNRMVETCQRLEQNSHVFGFSRKLLNWIFSSANMASPPSSPSIRVSVRIVAEDGAQY